MSQESHIRLAASLISSTMMLCTAALLCVGMLIANTAAQPNMDSDQEIRSMFFGAIGLLSVVALAATGLFGVSRTLRAYKSSGSN